MLICIKIKFKIQILSECPNALKFHVYYYSTKYIILLLLFLVFILCLYTLHFFEYMNILY